VTLFLLVAHIGAAIVFIGPATFASSAFARFARPITREVASALHATTRAYVPASVVVGAVGIVLAALRALFSQGWLVTAVGLFIVALGVLLGIAVPAQEHTLDILQSGVEIPASLKLRLRLGAGFFALCWLIVLALMVTKPF
jgi:hypothetical protein